MGNAYCARVYTPVTQAYGHRPHSQWIVVPCCTAAQPRPVPNVALRSLCEAATEGACGGVVWGRLRRHAEQVWTHGAAAWRHLWEQKLAPDLHLGIRCGCIREMGPNFSGS